MPYINDKKAAEIRNALAAILRASFDSKQQDRREDIVRQAGKIGGLLSQKNIKKAWPRIDPKTKPPGATTMKNTPENKYSEIVEQCKQALTVIILSADIIGTGDGLSPEGEKCLEQIRTQAWRINRELKKAE